jgi:CobQ-like glutamine amidotransferase family enzyme
MSARLREPAVGIAVLYPELLGTYGDGGNAVVLAKRLEWRGIDAEIVTVRAGDPVPETCRVYVLGGGEDGPQTEACRELEADGALQRAVLDHGAALLAVCAGMQICGTSFVGPDGAPAKGLGLLDCTTVRTGEPRAVGELLVDGSSLGTDARTGARTTLGTLTGFENHGGRTRLGPEAVALGTVRAGIGNGDGTEGVRPAGAGGPLVIGTYLHGPVLARNPALADVLLAGALGAPLAELDDREHDELRRVRIGAVERGNLEGVAHRSWRDRLLRRN